MKKYMCDSSIVSGINRLDKSAFDYLFKAVFPSLLLYTEKIVIDKFEAEDIALLAFAKLWDKMQVNELQFATLAQIRAYVYFTAKNYSISYLRNAKKRRANDKLFRLYGMSETSNDSTELLKLESLILEKIFSEIDKLPDKCQQVVKLCFFSKLSRREVATLLNLSKNTVDSHVKYAIQKLKNVFSEKDLALFTAILVSLSRH